MRAKRAAVVLQNALYWRPLERREYQLQWEEARAAEQAAGRKVDGTTCLGYVLFPTFCDTFTNPGPSQRKRPSKSLPSA